jgi:hypothetical protein
MIEIRMAINYHVFCVVLVQVHGDTADGEVVTVGMNRNELIYSKKIRKIVA